MICILASHCPAQHSHFIVLPSFSSLKPDRRLALALPFLLLFCRCEPPESARSASAAEDKTRSSNCSSCTSASFGVAQLTFFVKSEQCVNGLG